MKKILLSLAFLVVASTAFAQLGALQIPQQIGPQSGDQTMRTVVPNASDVLGFDANKKLVNIATTGTGNIARVTGVASAPASVASTGAIKSSSPSGGVGYATGAGGAATQLTNRTTGVTMVPNPCTSGTITTVNSSLAVETAADFIVTDSAVAIGDVVVACIQSGSNSGNTSVSVSVVTNGTFTIRVSDNNAAGGTAETGVILINFCIIKAVSS
jgi:hypothetical protein